MSKIDIVNVDDPDMTADTASDLTADKDLVIDPDMTADRQ